MLEYILDAVKSHDGCSEEQHIHVPQEFFHIRWHFLQKSGSELSVVTGDKASLYVCLRLQGAMKTITPCNNLCVL